jgi:ADP-ribosyl-[dinitrogen reductase] hydrolase
MDKDKAIGMFMGLYIGDALGAPLEFMRPHEFDKVTDMIGGGVHSCEVGEYTDDGAMSTCIADAYKVKGGFAPQEIALNFKTWAKTGHFGTRDYRFDIGRTCFEAIEGMSTEQPYQGRTDARSSGNGSIMRIAPVVLANHNKPNIGLGEAIAVSLMTHGNADTVHYMSAFVAELYAGKQLDEFAHLIDAEYDIRKGKGSIMYAYNAAWESVDLTFSFQDALVLAVNKGYDADTVGAVTGMLAGRHYGYSAIPKRWLNKLMKHDELLQMAETLYEMGDQ